MWHGNKNARQPNGQPGNDAFCGGFEVGVKETESAVYRFAPAS
jgi:hypothetical protein